MKLISPLLILTFWLGALIIFTPKKPDLKDRINAIYGNIVNSEPLKKLRAAAYELRYSGKRSRMMDELSESMAYISNMVVLGRSESLSAEMLLMELSDFSKTLSPVYLDMVHSLHENDTASASGALYAALKSNTAKDIGSFLAGWDRLPPGDMKKTLELYTSTLRDERETRRLKQDEAISDLVYLPAVVNTMAVLMNFIYVAFFVEQREALMNIF